MINISGHRAEHISDLEALRAVLRPPLSVKVDILEVGEPVERQIRHRILESETRVRKYDIYNGPPKSLHHFTINRERGII